MNTVSKATSALGLLLLLLAPAAAAQAPQTLSYQGFLTGNNGNPLTTNATLTFVLWTHPTSTNPIHQVWTETHTGVPVADGLYTVSLGSNTSFAGQGVAFDQAYWLGITVNAGSGPGTLTPRRALEAAPYAFHAMNAGSAGSAWSLTGNGGTTPGANFVGTTDNIAFEVKVNGVRALRLEPTAGAPNVVAGAASNAVTAGAVSATIGGGQDNTAGDTIDVAAGTYSEPGLLIEKKVFIQGPGVIVQ